jgi:tetratricopeptide (TPR) repeat protein
MSKKKSTSNLFSKERLPEDLKLHEAFFFEKDSKNDHVKLLQDEGIAKLKKGEIEGCQLLDLAANLDPTNHYILYEQGLSLYKHGRSTKAKKYLLLANKKFKKALSLHEKDFLTLKALGSSLHLLSKMTKDHHFLLDAKEYYAKALKNTANIKPELLAETYWDYGKINLLLSKKSEEVSDLSVALNAHKSAVELNENLGAAFWSSYSSVALNIGMQINDSKLFIEAIRYQKTAIAKESSNWKHWCQLARCLSKLFFTSSDEDHFLQANEAFITSAKLNPSGDSFYLSWAKLLFASGKKTKQVKRLYSAIEKCGFAQTLNSANPKTYSIWSIALTEIGSLKEDLSLLYDAENKAHEGFNYHPSSTDLYFAKGYSLYAQGNYFGDCDLYHQAIEKFQEGLSIDRTCHKLWYHLGYTYSTLAKIEGDPSYFERAVKFFTRAIHLNMKSTYLFAYAQTLLEIAEIQNDEVLLSDSITHFRQAISLNKNAIFIQTESLYQYAKALDLYGDYKNEKDFYVQAIDVLKKILLVDPTFPNIHHKLGLVYDHLGELLDDKDILEKALIHFKIAEKTHFEDGALFSDHALTKIHLAEISLSSEERYHYYKEAEYKLMQSAKLGFTEAYYHLAALYSLSCEYEKAILFLNKCVTFDALPPLDDVMDDEWLENLRHTEIFQSFFNEIKNY